MKADLEFVISHDGRYWQCRNNAYAVSGVSLAEVDNTLESTLKASGRFPSGTTVVVYMCFDYATIPTWIRQYADHYFNRFVTMTL